MPAEPAANPFALSPRRVQQVSVSDEVTSVKLAIPPSLSLPPPVPPPSPASVRPGSPTVIPPSRVRGGSRVPPPLPPGHNGIPRELPRASMLPPKFDGFDGPPSSVPAREPDPLPGSPATLAKPRPEPSSDSLEPMAITRNPFASRFSRFSRHPSLAAIAGARPSASWAAALVALGVFGGVVTAIVAGGETDSLLRAGATFIDPNTRSAIAMQLPTTVAPTIVNQVAEPAHAAPPAPADTIVVGEPVDIGPLPPGGGPAKRIADARTDSHPSRSESRPAPKPEQRVAAVVHREAPRSTQAVARVEKAEKSEKAEKPEKADKPEKPEKVEKVEKVDDDAALAKQPSRKQQHLSAAQADALAKAQLEGSL